MLRRFASCVCIAITVLLGVSAVAAPQQYAGKLQSRLFALNGKVPLDLAPATDQEKSAVEGKINKDASVLAGSVALYGDSEGPKVNLLLVQQSNGNPYLYVDADRDGKFSLQEKIKLKKSTKLDVVAGTTAFKEVAVNIPLTLAETVGKYYLYPVKFSLSTKDSGHTPSDVDLQVSNGAAAYGKIRISDKKVLVQYAVNMKARTISPLQGLVGADADLDGRINQCSAGHELSEAKGQPVVLRAGSRYFATTAVNSDTGRIIAEERPASEYVVLARTNAPQPGTLCDNCNDKCKD